MFKKNKKEKPKSIPFVETAECKKQVLLDAILNGCQLKGENKRNIINMIEDEIASNTEDIKFPKEMLNKFVDNLYDDVYWKSDSMHEAIFGATVRQFYNYLRSKTPSQLGFSDTYRGCLCQK